MGKVYVEEFLFRGRCPDCEPDKAGDYHVILAEFVKGPDGAATVVRSAPMTPAQAEAAGFNLSKIVSSVLGQMSRDLENAKIARDNLRQRYENILAQKSKEIELAGLSAVDLVRERDAARGQLEVALRKINELEAVEPPKKRSLLNIVTLGALDK